jgi:hypothetical protein
MTTTTESENRKAQSAKPRRQRRIALWQHRALRAEWAKFSPQLLWEGSEDEARHRWSSEVLHRPVTTWATLTTNEANRLLRVLKESSGSNAAYRARFIARLAVELFGSDWDAILCERLTQRFRTPNPQSLSPSEAHAEIEELLSRLARRDGVGIEIMRARFAGQKAEVRRIEN